MASETVRHVCAACGKESLRWEGRCPGCGEWNSLEELPRSRTGQSRRRAGKERRPSSLSEAGGAATTNRRSLNVGDLDLVLGGGVVPGSVVLLGGAPGIGKSTLLLQLAAVFGRADNGSLYVSGEESAEQVRLRAERVGGGAEHVLFLAETNVGAIVAAAEGTRPSLLCVDSIQTLRTPDLTSVPGSTNQVRECASLLQAWAKETGTATFLVGHVTKGGTLAGPRTLEHLVDVVLHFEGPGMGEHRLLRATKNRFGGVGEVAVFRMSGSGLISVADPALAFLEGRPSGVSGTAVGVALEGSRPFLAEVQALTVGSRSGVGQHRTTGFSPRRLAMLVAVLERRGGLSIAGSDVFVNVVGGLRLLDPATDLAVVAALASAELDCAVMGSLAFIGEVGLGGEIRAVDQMEGRLREVKRAGLKGAVVPLATSRANGVRRVEHVRDVVSLLRNG